MFNSASRKRGKNPQVYFDSVDELRHDGNWMPAKRRGKKLATQTVQENKVEYFPSNQDCI